MEIGMGVQNGHAVQKDKGRTAIALMRLDSAMAAAIVTWVAVVALIASLFSASVAAAEAPVPETSLARVDASVQVPQRSLEGKAERELQVAYVFHLGGIRTGRMTLDASWTKNAYALESRVRTEGLIEALIEGQYVSWSEGTLIGKAVRPRLYTSNFVANNDHQFINLSFNEEEPTALVAKPPYDLEYPVSRDLKRRTVDPMSAYLHVVVGSSVDDESPCGRSVPIYDGRRRYDLNVKYMKRVSIRSKDPLGYNGPGFKCRVRFKQVAGFHPNDLDANPIPPFIVQIASIQDANYLVPVKVSVSTDFGVLVGRATSVKLNEMQTVTDTRDPF